MASRPLYQSSTSATVGPATTTTTTTSSSGYPGGNPHPSQHYMRANNVANAMGANMPSRMMSGPPMGAIPPMQHIGGSPPPHGGAGTPPTHRSLSPHTTLTVAPDPNQPLRDWEGFTQLAEARRVQTFSPTTPRGQTGYNPPMVKREGSPSVAVLQDATERGNTNYAQWVKRADGIVASPASASRGLGNPADRASALLDHQGFLAWKRDEFRRRMEAEERGEVYTPRNYPGESSYLMQHGEIGKMSGTSRGIVNEQESQKREGMMSIDFTGRKHKLKTQVLATADELAWLEPPPIPEPIGWKGCWDLCAGHELLLQHMAVSGATPQNSPSLTQHFMYPDLLSAIQRLMAGTYLIRYHSYSEPPHERYFYLKSLPLANMAQYTPFLCWATHKHSHNAIDAIPLVNVMWVTQGLHSPHFRKYYLGGNAIQGPFVGKRKIECLAYGCFTVWYYDGKGTKAIDLLATDPLVFTLWMKLFEDIAQLNATLDTTGKVKSMQKHIENLREDGSLAEFGIEGEKKKSWMSKFNLQ